MLNKALIDYFIQKYKVLSEYGCYSGEIIDALMLTGYHLLLFRIKNNKVFYTKLKNEKGFTSYTPNGIEFNYEVIETRFYNPNLILDIETALQEILKLDD